MQETMNKKSEISQSLNDVARALTLAGTALERLAKCIDKWVPNSATLAPACAEAASPRQFAEAKPPSERRPDVSPRIGGYEFGGPIPGVFTSPAYLEKYQPGERRDIYVAACSGLSALSRKREMPFNKVSTTAGGRVKERLKEIGAERYGAWHIVDGNLVQEPGFEKWKTYRPPPNLRIARNSPVSVVGSTLRVIMPATMISRQFDKRFDELVYLGSPTSSANASDLMTGAERSCSSAKRFTKRVRSGHSETEAAREIVIFRAHGDFDRLVSIVERVVLEGLGLSPETV